ncbi:MAG: hypothetical protein J6K75_07610 [Erysipelotrichaceae bacterium]|nr:hypothetical protein [Erysipelotrichaceae bacterium]
MLLLEKFNITFCHEECTEQHFPSCRNLVKYLRLRGVDDVYELNEKGYLLKESLCSNLEQNLLAAYFVFDERPVNTKNQVFLSELIIHLFFRDGIDLMKASEVKKFFEIAASFFPTCYPNYDRKILGSIIRKSDKLISYKQGGYVLIKDVESFWDDNEIIELQEEVRKELRSKMEIDPDDFYKKHKHRLCSSKINNSHYLFSVLKVRNIDDDIVYYRNTFNKKIRRIK